MANPTNATLESAYPDIIIKTAVKGNRDGWYVHVECLNGPALGSTGYFPVTWTGVQNKLHIGKVTPVLTPTACSSIRAVVYGPGQSFTEENRFSEFYTFTWSS
jgi:hypothetical protein